MKLLNGVNLGALRAVETVGRLGSLRAAAQELGVTSGAVSQQIIKAETQLNCALFLRHSKGLKPTRIGGEVLSYLSDGFAVLEHAVSLCRPSAAGPITVSVAPVFAGKWLVWRLGRFAKLHPEIPVRIDASVGLVQPRAGEIDACIRVGLGEWPGLHAEELFPQRVFPVCSPAIREQLCDVSQLRQVPIIRDQHAMFGWNVWLDPNGMKEADLGPGPDFSDASLCLDAAIAGQGVFLAWETLANDALAAGRLVTPFPGRFRNGISYWFVEPKGRPRSAKVEAFRAWLSKELLAGGVN
jgi:DNA-binding transcriptional LysR family regulator